MKRYDPKSERVLALDPAPRGFGFAVLEGSESLIDWGFKATRARKRVQTLWKVRDLIGQYRPAVVVVEDVKGRGSRRCRRVQNLIDAIRSVASIHKVRAPTFSRSQIRRAFAPADAVTKHDIARTVARQFPELALLVPPRRRAWMSEDQRMHIFDAVSLALTYFDTRPKRRPIGPAPSFA